MTEQERIEAIAKRYSEIIQLLGEDTNREGLVKTPMRAAKALWFMTSGYRNDPREVMKSALFEHNGSKVVIVNDIEFYSLCEHHVLPFFGRISIAYIPSGKIVGLSKIARAVDICARRLQVQERFTLHVLEAVREAIGTSSVLVTCTAQHLCMKMRGVEKQNSSTFTVDYCGKFNDDSTLRTETLAQMKS